LNPARPFKLALPGLPGICYNGSGINGSFETCAGSEVLGELKHLRYSEADRIAVLTEDRPAVHNAIGLTTMPELAHLRDYLEGSSAPALLVLRRPATGPFISGGDPRRNWSS